MFRWFQCSKLPICLIISKSKETLHNVLINISENLKIGGKFIATMFDGRKIFKMLKGKDSIEVKDPKDRLLWSIKKNMRLIL